MDSANNPGKASGRKKKTSKRIDFSSQPVSNQIDFSSQSNQVQQFSQYQHHQQFSQPQQLQHQFSPQPRFSPQPQFSHPQFHSPNSYPQQPYNYPSTKSNPYMFTHPFSQYDSQSQFPQNSPHHSPQNSPPTEDEANVVEVVGVPKDSARPFTHEEDECLAKAFVTGTENPRNGRDQTSQVYWNDITRLYNEEGAILGLPARHYRSLQNRLRRLKYEVQTYIEAEKFVAAKHHSGWNQVMLTDAADAQFEKKNNKYSNKPFKCRHVLGILRNCAKFNAVTTRDNIPRLSSQDTESSPTTPYIGSNDSPEQSHEYHSGDKRARCGGEEVTSPLKHPERPIGNKAAKKASRGKGKVGEVSDMSQFEGLQLAEKRTNLLEEGLFHRKQAHAEKMKLYEESMEIRVLNAKNVARRLDVEEKKIEMRMQEIAAEQEMRRQQIEADIEIRRQQIESDKEMKIFNKDLNSITCPAQREATRRMQERIMAKWNL